MPSDFEGFAFVQIGAFRMPSEINSVLYVRIWPTSGSNLDVFKVAFLRSIVALIDISTWAHEVSHSLHPNTCKVKVDKAKNKIICNKVVQIVKKWKTCININCRYIPMISLDHQSFNWINYQLWDNWLVHIVRFWTTLFALQYEKFRERRIRLASIHACDSSKFAGSGIKRVFFAII